MKQRLVITLNLGQCVFVTGCLHGVIVGPTIWTNVPS